MNNVWSARIARATATGLIVALAGCGAPTGAGAGGIVSGTVSSSLGGAIENATVTVTPAGASSLATVETTSTGSFSVDNVPVGDGTVTVSDLPGNCEPTASVQYTGLKNGGKRVLTIIAGCN